MEFAHHDINSRQTHPDSLSKWLMNIHNRHLNYFRLRESSEIFSQVILTTALDYA